MDNGASSYRRFLDGDDTGLAEIVREYSDGLTLYLCGIVNDFSTAEELMEETLFTLITKKPQYRTTPSFKTWLYTIGRHVAVDYLRRRKRADVSWEELEGTVGDRFDLEQHYLVEEQKIALHQALNRLHAEYRQVLWLLYFEGLSHAETAAVMGKTPRQMKNLVFRAKNALRSELEKEGFVYEELR